MIYQKLLIEWHEALDFEIHTNNTSGNLLQWYTSYLYKMRQRLSSTLCTNASTGVPQGSLLWTLLFISYISDVAANMLFFCGLYADDDLPQHCALYVPNIEMIWGYSVISQISSHWNSIRLKQKQYFLQRSLYKNFQSWIFKDPSRYQPIDNLDCFFLGIWVDLNISISEQWI